MNGAASYLKHITEKIGEKLNLFHKSVLGVYAEEGIAYVVCLKKEAKEWRLSGRDRFLIEDDVELPAKVRLATAKGGWPLAPTSLCLPEQEATVMTAGFKGVEPDEMAESVYWEIYGRKIFGDEKFLSLLIPLTELDDYYWIAAVAENSVKKLRRDWAEHDLELSGFTVLPEEETLPDFVAETLERLEPALDLDEPDFATEEAGWANAVYAAAVLIANPELNFFDSSGLVDRRRLAGFWLAALLICLTLLSGVDYYRLQQAESVAANAQTQLNLLADRAREKREIEQLWKKYRVKSKILTELTKNRLPWHGFAVRLGVLPMEGIRLSEISLAENGNLLVKGTARNYDRLAEFLSVAEREINSTASLEKAELDAESGDTNFFIEIELGTKP